jgi:hypothetical protein
MPPTARSIQRSAARHRYAPLIATEAEEVREEVMRP